MTDDLTHYMEATERMRIRAEQAEAERDHLQDDLASVAMAVAGDRTGVIEQDDIVGLVREVVAERDRLRAVVDAVRVMWDNIVGTEDDAVMGFPVSDYNAIEEALDALDGSDATDG